MLFFPALSAQGVENELDWSGEIVAASCPSVVPFPASLDPFERERMRDRQGQRDRDR